ncbi:MAG: 4Fe-4S dicluster domain-containing protein [Treponema sp.]|jgi:ferredoxin|nr:4Fe-4S dicluster domain-containing protein [Treponema sp.]
MGRPRISRIIRIAPAWIRAGLALAVLGVLVYAYWPAGQDFNGILARMIAGQFSAALSGTGLTGLAALCGLAAALLSGRVFCSVLCPLGTLQELLWRIKNHISRKGRNNRNASYTPPALRYAVPLLAGAGLAFSFTPLMAAFDPISNFGRGMGALRGLFNGPAEPFALVLALPFGAILIAALFWGRAFCDWCPVGITLGLFARAAPFKMRIGSQCVSCGRCAKQCPARCINAPEQRIDAKRCVLCFSCAAVCPAGSIGYGLGGKTAPPGESRRAFLRGAASLFCGAAYLLGANIQRLAALYHPGGQAAGLAGGKPPILPPGAKNLDRYRSRCIGCQACAAACPSKIIRVRHSVWPDLDYAEAPCQYNCVECGRVCPTGAIRRLDREEKHRTRIALSALLFERCVVNTKGQACGACAEVCPTRAVWMAAYTGSGVPPITRPVFDGAYCIGCGACFAACPAEPGAFNITGAAEQTLTPGVRAAEDGGEGVLYQPADDFPF